AATPNGHLIVESRNALYDVDPSQPFGSNARLIASAATGELFDGVTVSLDGTVAYVARYPASSDTRTNPSHVSGYRIIPGTNVFNSGPIPGSVDGTAIGTGALAGYVVANTNAGTVVLVNLTTLAQTVIANGGGRGDFATLDPNGTL